MIGQERPTIESGLSTYWRPCWCQTRQGQIIRLNGIQRGSISDGMGTAKELGMDAPDAGPTVVADVGAGASLDASYWCAFRYIDDSGEITAYSDLSPLTEVDAATDDGFDWTVPYSAQSRCTKIELYRSTGDQAKVLYLVTTLDNPDSGNATYGDDNSSDATMRDNDALPILAEQVLYARRFGMPPDWKRVAVQFQDRTWYLVDAVYDEGTVAVTNDSATVTGSGTHVTDEMVGRYFYVRGGDKQYVIDTVNTGAQTWTLSVVYGGTTAEGKAYAISPGVDENNMLYFSEPDEPESVPTSQNTLKIQENVDDHDFLTGGIAMGAVFWATKNRHVYRVTYVTQPQIDAHPRLRFFRGCLSQDCHVILWGSAYLLDAMGPWRIAPNEEDEAIGPPIQDFFRDAEVDWGKAKWWHVDADANLGIIRFWVTLIGQAGLRPKTALCYKVAKRKWWTETYNEQIGGCCRAKHLGRVRSFAAGQYDRILLLGEGASDGVSEQEHVAGANATYVAIRHYTKQDMIGHDVVITSGPGAGQRRTVLSLSTPMGFTVDTWEVTPIADVSTLAIQYAVSGTVTSATADTLVDSARDGVSTYFAAYLAGARVTVTSRTTGVQQSRCIEKAALGTLTLTENWTTTPVAGDEYVIGAIPWTYQTGKRPLAGGPRALGIHYLPTENAATLQAAAWFDHETDAALIATHASPGAAVTVGADKRHAILDLRRQRSTLDDEPGWREIAFGAGGRPTGLNQRRAVSYKLWGDQAIERISLYGLRGLEQ